MLASLRCAAFLIAASIVAPTLHGQQQFEFAVRTVRFAKPCKRSSRSCTRPAVFREARRACALDGQLRARGRRVRPDGADADEADRSAAARQRRQDLRLRGRAADWSTKGRSGSTIRSPSTSATSRGSRGLRNADRITVRQLMTHTSGLVRYELNPKFTADLTANPDKVWTPARTGSPICSTRSRRSRRARAGNTPTPTTSSSA